MRSITPLFQAVLPAVLTASIIQSPAYGSTCKAEIKVGATSARGPRFSFVAKSDGSPIEVFAIAVVADGQAVCGLRRKADGSVAIRMGDWNYGDVPPGFKVETACRPLVRGKRYEIEVVGSCVGYSSFRFEPPPEEKKQ
jgi:hypothetical protein